MFRAVRHTNVRHRRSSWVHPRPRENSLQQSTTRDSVKKKSPLQHRPLQAAWATDQAAWAGGEWGGWGVVSDYLVACLTQ